ncbi:4365_t:CDS:2 [Racocetra persica]|uniref:4365_t:CDS:1 n=1 Tax=Racocetra persica TaxID=160502 RepID=A0ACA9L6W0_9GLOM|nr:4365_t:CDS:2 [Racocetra persica]
MSKYIRRGETPEVNDEARKMKKILPTRRSYKKELFRNIRRGEINFETHTTCRRGIG